MKKPGVILLIIAFIGLGVSVYLPKSKEAAPIPESSVLGITDAVMPTSTPTQLVLPEISDTLEVTPSPTETVTPQPTKSQIPQTTTTPTPTTEAPLLVHEPRLEESATGNVTTLNFGTLQSNTLYHFDLSAYAGNSFVISWQKGVALQWSTASTPLKSTLIAVPIDDELEGNETEYFSGLLTVPEQKTFYIYSPAQIPTLTISVINPAEENSSFTVQATSGIYNFNSGASYTALPIVTRDEWGANPSSWDSNSNANIDDESRLVWLPVYYKVARIAIHHTATGTNSTNPAAAVRSIYLYHAYVRDREPGRDKGWGDIGYNYLIDQNGTIYQGKLGGDETQGYHIFGSGNRISLGIALIGDFTSAQPTSKARASLVKLLAERAAFYGFSLKYSDGGSTKWKDPTYTVFAHRTSYRWYSGTQSWGSLATGCPGEAFFPKLPSVVAEAEAYRQQNFTSLKSVVTQVNTSFAQPHDEGKIIVRYNVPVDTAPSVIESYLPKFSGITNYAINGNTVTISLESTVITHPYYSDSEYLLPPMNWTGYDNEYATFSKPFVLNGPEDRAKTLLKIFKMDPKVEAADVKHYLSTQ